MTAVYGFLALGSMTTVCRSTAHAESAPPSHEHWAFQPITRPVVPDVLSTEWVRTPVDSFVLAQLEQVGLAPSPPSPRHVLMRRLSANLLGIMPSAELVDSFIGDNAPGAYERYVEELLQSPHYGERWGRHWLDVARYAESGGYVENRDWAHVWRYRDWVVNCFNKDQPYDLFIQQQIAGDELLPYDDDNLVATGFLASARLATEELSCVRQENDMYVDIVNATSSAVLGLTMACCQCHDHMFDPSTQEDYYRMQAFFLRGYPGNLVLQDSVGDPGLHETASDLKEFDLQVRGRVLAEGIDEFDEPLASILRVAPADRTPEQESQVRVARAQLNIRIAGCNGFRINEDEKKRLDELRGRLSGQAAAAQQTRGFYSPVTSPHRVSVLPMSGNFPLIHDTGELSSRVPYLLTRGDPYRAEYPVTPGFPAVLDPEAADREIGERPRTELARWLTSRQNPLTARVWVNRIWSYHFGGGLVATVGNFGLRGAQPTHPGLLDYLAMELIDSGWSTKHIQRLIVKSNTYRQSAKFDPARAEVDPDNQLYWRWPRRRLEAEAIRDMMLSSSGRLDSRVGGPNIPHGQPSDRRSLYLSHRRDQPDEMRALFDGPTLISASCAMRSVSTSAIQPLYLLNSPQAVNLAHAFAARLIQEAPDDLPRQVDLAFRYTLGRPPDEEEVSQSTGLIDHAREHLVPTEWDRQAKIAAVDVAEGASDANAPDARHPSGAMVLSTSPVPTYILHLNGFEKYSPPADRAMITYEFDRPESVTELECLVHVNGIVRMEGFAGDSLDELVSIGEATVESAARDKPFPNERGAEIFKFPADQVQAGRFFRFVVRETVLADGYANFQAFPRVAGNRRMDPTPELVPSVVRPLTPLAKFSQAMLNLNEYFYVP